MKERLVSMYVTPGGAALCRRLKTLLGGKLDILRLDAGCLDRTFRAAWQYDGIIAVMAAGIVVRGIAPHLKAKTADPAVVVMDEAGRFAISLLSGHMGGANELARKLADLTGALAVITTASDVKGIAALDLYASERGCTISDMKRYRKFAMAQVKGETINVFVEKGEDRSFFEHGGFRLFTAEREFLSAKGLKLAVTWRILDGKDILFFVPRRLVVGIGFHKGMDSCGMAEFLGRLFERNGLALEGIKKIVTIDIRKGERGFAELCATLGAEPVFFPKDKLDRVKRVGTSTTVKKHVGTGSVSEACAVLGSNRGALVAAKEKGGMITACVALERYS